MSVFAPTPVLSIDIEPGTDHPEVHVHAGAQGPWIANMLEVLDTRAVLCAPLGGEIGMVLGGLLDERGMEVRRVQTEGTSACQVEDRRSGDRECVAQMDAAVLNRHECDELYNLALAAGLDTGVIVLTGPSGTPTLDPDVYRRIACDLTRLGVVVLADLSGDALSAAVEGGVAVLKVSDEETGNKDPLKGARKLRKKVSSAVLLTRASAPALLLTDELQEVRVPELQTVDHRGAGDSMTAGIAAGLARGLSLEEAVRLGAAAGAVNVTRHGLASGRRDTIERMADKVCLAPATKKEVRRARTHHQ